MVSAQDGLLSLREQSLAFAQEIGDLLEATIGCDKQMVSLEYGDRYVVRPAGDSPKEQRIPLGINGLHLADLNVSLYQALDRTGTFLKTSTSTFEVVSKLERRPLLRLEYNSSTGPAAVAHWHFHAERGAFTHLLSVANSKAQSKYPNPHDLSKVHLPVGGERFRPCLEDVVEMLIKDCGVDSIPGWQGVLEEGRRRWRLRQLRAVVRDQQEETARVMRSLGWKVKEPAYDLSTNDEPFRRW